MSRHNHGLFVGAALLVAGLVILGGFAYNTWGPDRFTSAPPSTRALAPTPQPDAPVSSKVREVLDFVGGTGVPIAPYDGNCGHTHAPMCTRDGTIRYDVTQIRNLPWPELHWALDHELAHVYQSRVYPALTKSTDFNRLYNRDPEHLANCC